MDRNSAKRGSFAIPLALFAVAILSVLALTFPELVHRQKQSSTLRLHGKKAQKNAFLGFRMALGRMQELLGDDGGVTFSAGLLKPELSNGARFWTGVWLNEGSVPVWLNSGSKQPSFYQNAVNASGELTAEDAVIVVGKGDVNLEDNDDDGASDVAVVVPIEKIEGGHFAYWVADNSQKVSLAGAVNTSEPFLPSGLWPYPDLSELFENWTPSESLAIYATSFPGIFFNRFKVPSSKAAKLFHDVGFLSLGVLSSNATGLLQDLSVKPELLGAGLKAHLRYTDYMEAFDDPDDLRRYYRIRSLGDSGLSDAAVKGTPLHAVAPVLTEFAIAFDLHREVTEDRSRGFGSSSPPYQRPIFRFVIFLELWNPYASGLISEPMQLNIEGLPTVEVFFENDPSPRQLNLNALMTQALGRSSVSFDLPVGTLNTIWPAGGLQLWSGPNNWSVGAQTPVTELQAERKTVRKAIYAIEIQDWEWPIQGGSYPNFRLRAPATNLSLSISRAVDGVKLLRLENFNFNAFDTPPRNFSDIARSNKFGYHFKLLDPAESFNRDNSTYLASEWLRLKDVRATAFSNFADGLYVTASGSKSPLEVAGHPNVFEEASFFDRAESRRITPSVMEQAPIFELPRAPVFSLGQLQHLHFKGLRAFALGNSWAKQGSVSLNAHFDRFFLSGLDAEAQMPTLRHPSLFWISGSEPKAVLDAEEPTAAHLLRWGAFNVNSLSVDAWEAVLRRRFKDGWVYATSDGFGNHEANVQAQPPAGLGRFAHSLQEVYQIESIPSYDDRDYYFAEVSYQNHPSVVPFRRGWNDFDAVHEGKRLSRHLAEAIVRRTRQVAAERQRPTLSLQEWLDPIELDAFEHPDASGTYMNLLERAIADVPKLNEGVWHQAPAFLTSADIMAALAPVAVVRGDTFVIRAWGSSVDELDNIKAVALCEAIVQRVPRIFDENDNIQNPGGFGRRFIIINFRWIDIKK